MRLLVVEDQRRLRDQLTNELKRSGYAVDFAENGERALVCFRDHPYDMAIVDLGLPKVDGVTVIERVRADGLELPILILTARSDWEEKVRGLEAGADDYLVKPFHMEELKARLQALLRRSGGRASPMLRFGPIEVDTNSKTVTRRGEPVELTGYEYNALEYMLHRPGAVISKTEFVEHLYHQEFDRDSNVIEVFIGRLRKKLDPDGTLEPIATVRGQGYRFDLEEAGG